MKVIGLDGWLVTPARKIEFVAGQNWECERQRQTSLVGRQETYFSSCNFWDNQGCLEVDPTASCSHWVRSDKSSPKNFDDSIFVGELSSQNGIELGKKR